LNRVDGIITDDVFTSPNKKKEILENEKDWKILIKNELCNQVKK
jgi:hypothetical protein